MQSEKRGLIVPLFLPLIHDDAIQQVSSPLLCAVPSLFYIPADPKFKVEIQSIVYVCRVEDSLPQYLKEMKRQKWCLSALNSRWRRNNNNWVWRGGDGGSVCQDSQAPGTRQGGYKTHAHKHGPPTWMHTHTQMDTQLIWTAQLALTYLVHICLNCSLRFILAQLCGSMSVRQGLLLWTELQVDHTKGITLHAD